MALKSSGSIFSEINITPLTDIFLVLLIIMMVVAPMMQNTNSEIKIPQLESGKTMDPAKLTVEVTKDGRFFVDGTEQPESALAPTLKERGAQMEEKNIIIRADVATRSGAVMKVFEAAKEASFAKVTIAGDSLSQERQEELSREVIESAPLAAPTAQPSAEEGI